VVRDVHPEAVGNGLVEQDGRGGKLPELVSQGTEQVRPFIGIFWHGLVFFQAGAYYLSN